jgi:hypothetical protein
MGACRALLSLSLHRTPRPDPALFVRGRDIHRSVASACQEITASYDADCGIQTELQLNRRRFPTLPKLRLSPNSAPWSGFASVVGQLPSVGVEGTVQPIRFLARCSLHGATRPITRIWPPSVLRPDVSVSVGQRFGRTVPDTNIPCQLLNAVWICLTGSVVFVTLRYPLPVARLSCLPDSSPWFSSACLRRPQPRNTVGYRSRSRRARSGRPATMSKSPTIRRGRVFPCAV